MIVRHDGVFHEWFIPKLAASLGSERYLELGTWHGDTFCSTAAIVLDRGGHAVGVDSAAAITVPGALVYQCTTDEFFDKIQPLLGYTYDLVFIDADHTARQVRADLLAVFPLVEEHGIICLHDTFPIREEDTRPGYSGDAWMVAQDLWLRRLPTGIRPDENYEVLTLPVGPGLTLIRKRGEKQVVW